MTWLMLAALFYPSVVKTDTNLFSDGRWENRMDISADSKCSWEKYRGGPFSEDEPVWKVTTKIPTSSFWRQDVKIEGGRKYLVGAWVRRDMAKAIIWCWGRTKSGKPYNHRLYLYGGFNSWLTDYLRPEIKRKLGGGGNEWHLMYRPIEADEELSQPVQFKFGIFMSTGSVEMSHPFLIDITDRDMIPLMVDVKGEDPISRLAVEHVGLRDLVWSKSFKKPVTEFSQIIEHTDALRGFKDANRVDGNMLSVTYSNGAAMNVYAPQEGVFMRR